MGSRQVFTKANAGRDFDWRPRAHSSATVASSRGSVKAAFNLLHKDGQDTIAEIVEFDLHPHLPGGCLFVGIVHDKGRYRQHCETVSA
jgi:hypothetical protein